jgi:hypothetical protein
MQATHPYGDAIIVAKVPGSAIATMLQSALDEHTAPGNGTAGNWPQVAGMSFHASWSGASWTLGSVEVGGVALANDAEYTIVTNQYIMDGNGGRAAISGAATSVETLSKNVTALMSDYFKANSPVSPPSLSFAFGTTDQLQTPKKNAAAGVQFFIGLIVAIAALFAC